VLKDTLRVLPRSHTQTDLRPHSSPTLVRTKKNGRAVDVGEGFFAFSPNMGNRPSGLVHAADFRSPAITLVQPTPAPESSVLALKRSLVAGMDLPPSIFE
jgi:hypothetical protein